MSWIVVRIDPPNVPQTRWKTSWVSMQLSCCVLKPKPSLYQHATCSEGAKVYQRQLVDVSRVGASSVPRQQKIKELKSTLALKKSVRKKSTETSLRPHACQGISSQESIVIPLWKKKSTTYKATILPYQSNTRSAWLWESGCSLWSGHPFDSMPTAVDGVVHCSETERLGEPIATVWLSLCTGSHSLGLLVWCCRLLSLSVWSWR